MSVQKLTGLLMLTKPIVTASVYYTWALTYLVAARSPSLIDFLLESLVVVLGISLGNALNNYIDRDIDFVMRRTTYRRPLARGIIGVGEARAFIVALGAASLGLAVYASIVHGYLVLVLYSLALLTYVYLYTAVLKRRTWMSILVGAIAYSCVLLHAWYVGCGSITLLGAIFALLGYTWVLTHLWSTAMYYAEDYALARVPTLPTAFWRRPRVPAIALTCSALSTCALASMPIAFGHLSPMYLPAVISALASETAFCMMCLFRDWRWSKRDAFVTYKMTYPSLAATLTILAVLMIFLR